MKPFKIQNRTQTSRRVKFIKNGGLIQFTKDPIASYVENSREAGFCLNPADPLPDMTGALGSIDLTAHPMGTDGRVSLYVDGELSQSIRYSNLNRLADRQAWFNGQFGNFVNYKGREVAVFESLTPEVTYRLVFEDDDLDFEFGEFGLEPSSLNPTLVVEQYRLAFDLFNNKIEINCDGANHTIYLAIQTTYSEESPTIFTIVDVGVPDEPKTIISLSGNTLPQNDDLVAPIIFASNSTYGDTFELRDYKVPYDEETINGQVKHIFLALTNRSDLDIRLQISVSDTSGQDLASVALGEGEDATNAVSVESPYEILACLNPYVEPLKEYLTGREEHQPSIVLIIRDWKTVGAWEFKIDGRDYLFKVGETIYDALVSLYGYNIAYPHRTDQLNGPEDRETFILYNNNAYAHTLTFKYVGDSVDPFEGILTIGSQASGTVVRTYDESKTMEIDLAGSKFGYVNQAKKFRIDWNASYLISGIFYVLEINGIEYRYTGTLEELEQYNGSGLKALLDIHPVLHDLVDIRDNGDYVSISNKTFKPMSVKLRLDRNMPYLNGVEEVWSKDNPKGLYLPTVPEVPKNDEDIILYPYGIIQDRNSVPINVSNEGYAFELAPSLAEPLELDITYLYELDSITRDPVNLSGQVNYSDARISLTWKDVVYIAQVDSVRTDGKYNWAFEELPYDLFEDVVVESLSGTISFTITAKTETDEVVRECDVTYLKTSFLKFIGNGNANNPIGFIGQTGDVVRYPDGTVLNVNTANTLAIPLKNMTGETVIELTGNRSYFSIVTLAGDGLVEVTELPRHARITGIKFNANIINLSTSRNLTKVPLSLPENIVNLSSAFAKCTKFNQDLSQWDTSNVTNMSSMFSGASAFNQPLNTWDTSKVTNMRGMFYQATAFNGDISTWDTSKVTDMSSMFSYANAFNSDISGWNTGNVADMIQMFYNANSFNSDISNWNTGSVTNMASMFERAYAFNQPIGNWDVSNVTNMSNMFETNVVFNQDLTNWNTGSVTNMSRMFYQATAFNGDISTWDTSNVTDMGRMFYKDTAFDSDISGWDVSKVTNMSSMFYEATAFNQPIGNWLTGKVESTSSMFYGASAFNQPIGNWDVSNVAYMSEMFCYAKAFNQDLSRWNTSNVTTLHRTFTSADAFNGDISTWDTSKVTDMSGMFLGAKVFNSDISGWDVSKVKDMEEMFAGAWVFNSDISGWGVSNVTDMYYMFNNAFAFNQPIGNWDVSKVTSMYSMFAGARAFNGDISGWDVSEVVSMTSMFYGVRAFNQDLSKWCVSKITTKPSYFDDVIESTSWVLPRPVWGTCPSRIEGPEEPGFGEHLILHSQGDIVLNAPVGSVLYSIDGGKTWQENSEYDFTVDLPSGVESAVYLKSNDDVELTDSLNVKSTNTNTSNFKGVHQWWDSSRPIRLGVSNNSFYVPKVAPPNVTNMSFMFTGASAFNSDISGWNVSKVTNMSSMFHYARAFNGDISQWNVSNVTDMNSMFLGAKAFNSDISQWDVSNVTSMYNMFYNDSNASAFNSDISGWNVSKVTNMSSMFYGATAFNQDLSSWCVSKIRSKPLDFDYNATKWTLPKPVWGTCPRGENKT